MTGTGRRRSMIVIFVATIGSVTLLALFLGGLAPVSASTPSDGGNVSAYQARAGQFANASDLISAIENGSLERAGRLVLGDTLVVKIESPRLSETMAAGNGTTTRRFFDALDGDAEFRIVQTNPDTMVNRKLAPVGPQNVTVFRDQTAVYLLIYTDQLRFVRNEVGRPAAIHGGERFAVEFGYHLPDLPLGGEYDSTGPVIELYPTTGKFDRQPYRYKPLPPEWIKRSVVLNIPADDSIFVRLTLHGSDRPITFRHHPTEYPAFLDFWLDLRDVDPGTGYTLELVHDGTVIGRYIGTVSQPAARIGNVTVTTIDNQTHVNLTARLSHGGKVQVLNEDCKQVGWTRVAPGELTRVSIDLWQEGKKVRVSNVGDFGIMVRALREAGSPTAVYRTGSTSVKLNWDGTDCRVPSREATPTVQSPEPPPTSEAKPETVSPVTEGSTPSPDHTGPESAPRETTTRTTAPGQPGFTPGEILLAVGVYAIAVLTRRL